MSPTGKFFHLKQYYSNQPMRVFEFGTGGILHTTKTTFDDYYEVNSGSSLSIAAPGVLSNDYSTTSTGSISAVITRYPTKGGLIFQSDGSFEYTPYPGENEDDTFAYRPVQNDLW